MIEVDKLIQQQFECWPQVRETYKLLSEVKTKRISMDDAWAIVQHNPARRKSAVSKIDSVSLANRPCFLCRENRPKEQLLLPWNEYEVLLNPYPIFPRHLTIAASKHIPQRIAGRLEDMARLSKDLPGFVILYNGPKCGASAPDHMHFQAGDFDFLPLFKQKCHKVWLAPGIAVQDNPCPGYPGMVIVEGETPRQMAQRALKVMDNLPLDEETGEPMMNLIGVYNQNKYVVLIIPRKAHRPDFYGECVGQMLLSPATVELSGVYITPRFEDFQSITPEIIMNTVDQVCFSQAEVKNLMQHLS